MFWILITSYFIFGASSYLLRRILAQEVDGNIRLMNSIFFICFLLPVGFTYALLVPHNLSIGWLNLFFLVGGSLIWPMLNLVAFYANKHTDVGVFTVINNISPIFTIAIAISFLGENLTKMQFIGITLLIASGIIAALSQIKSTKRSEIQGIGFAILAAVLLGIAVAYERFMLSRVDFGAYIIYGWGSQIFWAGVLAYKEFHLIPSLFSKSSRIRRTLFSWGMTSTLKSVSFISALKLGTAALVSSITNFLSVVVVLSAYIFLKERDGMVYKISATVIGITGLFLMS